jgi:hypothetical protein
VDIGRVKAELREVSVELAVSIANGRDALARVTRLLADLEPQPATSLTTTVQRGPNMGVIISVDDAGAHADYGWTDDHGDPVPAPLDDAGGAFVVTLASDNPAAATLAQDPSTATRFDITEVAVGGFNVVTTIVDSLGNPGVWPAGSAPSLVGTPITDPPVAASVIAGAAGELTTTASA